MDELLLSEVLEVNLKDTFTLFTSHVSYAKKYIDDGIESIRRARCSPYLVKGVVDEPGFKGKALQQPSDTDAVESALCFLILSWPVPHSQNARPLSVDVAHGINQFCSDFEREAAAIARVSVTEGPDIETGAGNQFRYQKNPLRNGHR